MATSPDHPLHPDPQTAGLAAMHGELRSALLAYLRRHTGDAHAAEDILHDIFLKALSLERAPDNLAAWLYTVAHNAAMDFHRRRRPQEELHDDMPQADPDQPAQALIELANCLRPMAERLPAIYRDALLAAEFEGRPLQEVANAQGLSLSAIKTRTSRGRRMLHAALVDCCRVELSASGQVADYDTRAAAGCAPVDSGAGTRGGTACSTAGSRCSG